MNGMLVRPKLSVGISISPRIHTTLVSMHDGGIRRNGGFGFALEGPSLLVHAEPSRKMSLKDAREGMLGQGEVSDLLDVLKNVAQERSLQPVALSLEGEMFTHVGMGSGTAIRLAAVEALMMLNRQTVDREDVVRSSRRGGTSGIGISTYFQGGATLDFGIANRGGEFLPSSLAQHGALPATSTSAMPSTWSVCLCLPRWAPTKTRADEAAFFRRVAPLPAEAAFEAGYLCAYGAYASVLDNDYDGFCRSINQIQASAWKAAEWADYGIRMIELRDALAKLGADCVGMSSLGPLLYCFGGHATLTRIEDEASRLNIWTFVTAPRNVGRTVQD